MKSKISVILLLLISWQCFGQTDTRILSSDFNSFVIEYTPKISDSNIVKLNNEDYLNVSFKGNIYDDKNFGVPSIPYYAFPLGVPSEFGNTIQILSSSFKDIQGKLLPVPKPVKINGIPSKKFEKGDKYYSFNTIGEDLAGFGHFGIVRGVPVQIIVIKPVQFNCTENKIRIYTKMVLKVSFSASQVKNSAVNDDFLKGVITNYSIARQWNTNAERLNKTKGNINSVLNSGKWYKFEAPNEGIYKITKSMLSSYGIDPNTVDPRTIKIYNNGGTTLPEDVTLPAPSDLVENAIYISGESDGKFDDSDYVLFYGRGTNFWNYNTSSKNIVRKFNPYSIQNYYWITSGGSNGKRIQPKQSESAPADYIQGNSKAFAYYHQDLINIASSGRNFLGDAFNQATLSRTYNNLLESLVPGSRIDYVFNFVNSDPINNVELKVDESGNTLYDSFIPGINIDPNPDYAYGHATQATASFTGTLSDNRSLLKFTFNASSAASKGYIDWFEIYYNRSLSTINDRIIFFSSDTTAKIEYDLNNFSNSNIQVYDITDYANVEIITNPMLLSGSEFKFISSEKQGFVSKYYAVGNNNFMTPVNPVVAENSNLHAFQDGAKFIIITPKDFMDQAVRLKSFKENHPKLNISTYVADVDQIFNEFSGGMKDVGGIRNFIKYAYDTWTVKPEYVLLFGDGTYDYKNVEGFGNNYIIPYETEFSLNLIDSYPMDDFYVRLSGNNDLLVDLGIGRITANSLADARIAVDKIISYESDIAKGSWQNLITMVADDQWTSTTNEGNYHVVQSETLASYYIPVSYDINKIYLGEYPTVITSFGRTKPGVTEDLVKSINNGTLIVNFIGHGSPELWTHEKVFENSSTIPRLVNSDLFFLTAATCDFGYYDNPSSQSGAELLLLKEGSGSIGSVTSSRPVYSDENAALNQEFYSDLLSSPRDTLNLPIPVGKAYYQMKLVRYGENDQKYHLFCDPSLRLSIPRYNSNIDSINGQTLISNVQIKALSNTRIHGNILQPDNSLWNNFNGEGILTVYDSQRQIGMTEQPGININLQGGIIFRGKVSVANGKFNSSFIVPKDISYENKNGKVAFLFYNNDADGLGYTNNVLIGGTDTTAVNDNKGPNIDIYFDDLTFKSSYLVNPDSKLIVKLSDPSGLNTTGTGIGHKIQGVLNDNITNPIDFTSYFTGDLDAGGKSGMVNYQFNNLDQGHYKLQVQAWDVFNNFSNETVFFDVVSGNDLTLGDVYNYPNPFSGKTTFTFQQNLDRIFNVKIKIYTVAGRLIKVIDEYGVHEKYVTIEWDGKDQDGNFIANGVYFYKVILNSTDGNFSKNVIGKLAKIR
ncbi:MAG: type IX secretion system sortase PorU [Ignavibacteriaceae bacterium]|nr:type IX secretion system sortase PorU [Ignavibacteriaceae bacterium]